ncbi:hypothetical protein A2U01_0110795, partial [Trifolium medium]|nr:hypothetical protein [Trifolium medium]
VDSLSISGVDLDFNASGDKFGSKRCALGNPGK